MSGSFLPSPWFSTNHSLLGSKEPALLCNDVDLLEFHLSDYRVNQALTKGQLPIAIHKRQPLR
jgi:hypothetical protein